MIRYRRPRVIVNPFANRYSAPTERIIEFSGGDNAGGLVSLVAREDGSLAVHIYRQTANVKVTVGEVSRFREEESE